MCKFKSAIVVKAGEGIIIFTVPYEDSHTEIREAHNIRDNSPLCKQTPVELVPVRGLLKIEHYDFVFDADKPDWWEEEFTEQVKEELFTQAVYELKDYKGKILNLSSATDLKGLVMPEKCGDVDLSSATDLKGLVMPEKCDNVDMRSATDLKGLVMPEKCGDVYLGSATDLKGLVMPKECGDVYLSSATDLKGLVMPEKCGDVHLRSLSEKEKEIIRKKFKCRVV